MKQDQITRRQLALEIERYLKGRVSLSELVDWAEKVMLDGDFSEEEPEVLRRIVGRLGVADVKAFGLTWENCQEYLSDLGYRVLVELTPA